VSWAQVQIFAEQTVCGVVSRITDGGVVVGSVSLFIAWTIASSKIDLRSMYRKRGSGYWSPDDGVMERCIFYSG
jgi:hypothetical protein